MFGEGGATVYGALYWEPDGWGRKRDINMGGVYWGGQGRGLLIPIQKCHLKLRLNASVHKLRPYIVKTWVNEFSTL